MVMTLILEPWEINSIRNGCNLYAKHFRFCALTVNKVEEIGRQTKEFDLNKSLAEVSRTTSSSVRSMYFREREKPVVDSDIFLALALPKILMALLIIAINGIAIITLVRSNGWIKRRCFFLPMTTQGLLHSLFLTYLTLGLVTLYSQISLSAFILAEFRFFEDQGNECLVVNSALIALSVAVSLHLLSFAVDRTLASYLSYNKYSTITKGTVPFWLTAIWLPCAILGSLPLAGWRNNFTFCIFMEQFNEDYLRFVSAFYLSCILIIPCLYFYFLSFLRNSTGSQEGQQQTLYRWHRKLQTHHKLTFVTILGFNVTCWTPFHLYLILACPTCPFSSFASGFLLEYLFIIALLPGIAIPIMFTIRSNILNQCADKLTRSNKHHTNPLSQKSKLFFIDTGTATTTLSSTLYKDTLSSKKGNFFVPRYLPMTIQDSSSNNTQHSSGGNKFIKNQKNATNSNRRTHAFKDFSEGRPNNAYHHHPEEEPIYANSQALISSSAATSTHTHETDSQCGFPIRPVKAPRRQAPPPPPPSTSIINLQPQNQHQADQQKEEQDHYYSTLKHN